MILGAHQNEWQLKGWYETYYIQIQLFWQCGGGVKFFLCWFLTPHVIIKLFGHYSRKRSHGKESFGPIQNFNFHIQQKQHFSFMCVALFCTNKFFVMSILLSLLDCCILFVSYFIRTHICEWERNRWKNDLIKEFFSRNTIRSWY